MTDINKVVAVQIGTAPTFSAEIGFGIMNIVGSSATLPQGDRFRYYADLAAVGVDFSGASEEYKAATKFFSASPSPGTLAISRRFSAATAAELLGGAATQVLATYQAITTGSFAITIDGGAVKQVTGINMSGAASMNAIAALIQTRLQVAAAGATCVWTGSRFRINSGTTGGASTISYAAAPAAGVDVSGLFELLSTDGGVLTQGAAAETISQSLAAIQVVNDGWYGLALTAEATEAEVISAAGWAEAAVKMHFASTTAANNKDAGSVLSLSYLLKAASYRRTAVVYNTENYAGVAYAGRLLTVNFANANSTITMKFKQLGGVVATPLTESERLALIGNNCNYYTAFGNSNMVAEGVQSNGTFSDEVNGLDWLQIEIENNVFAFLYSRTTKVPQTDRGVASIVQQVEKAFGAGVNNGLIAPGQWDGAALGTIETGDFLSKGFYVYAAPVADQSQASRDARIAPPISAIARGAGAIHSVNVGVTFVR